MENGWRAIFVDQCTARAVWGTLVNHFRFPLSVFRFSAWALTLAVLLAFLTACGDSGFTQTARTEHYMVQLNLDGVGFGQREATIDLHDSSGNPVAADKVVLTSVMHQMGMVAPETAAQSIAPGRYQATGEFFSMVGEWELDVRVSAGGAEEVATFKVPVTE
jgi:YtkA-like